MAAQQTPAPPDDSSWKVMRVLLIVIGAGLLILIGRTIGVI